MALRCERAGNQQCVILNLFQDLRAISYAEFMILVLEQFNIIVILNLFQDLRAQNNAKPIDLTELINLEILICIRMTVDLGWLPDHHSTSHRATQEPNGDEVCRDALALAGSSRLRPDGKDVGTALELTFF